MSLLIQTNKIKNSIQNLEKKYQIYIASQILLINLIIDEIQKILDKINFLSLKISKHMILIKCIVFIYIEISNKNLKSPIFLFALSVKLCQTLQGRQGVRGEAVIYMNFWKFSDVLRFDSKQLPRTRLCERIFVVQRGGPLCVPKLPILLR